MIVYLLVFVREKVEILFIWGGGLQGIEGQMVFFYMDCTSDQPPRKIPTCIIHMKNPTHHFLVRVLHRICACVMVTDSRHHGKGASVSVTLHFCSLCQVTMDRKLISLQTKGPIEADWSKII